MNTQFIPLIPVHTDLKTNAFNSFNTCVCARHLSRGVTQKVCCEIYKMSKDEVSRAKNDMEALLGMDIDAVPDNKESGIEKSNKTTEALEIKVVEFIKKARGKNIIITGKQHRDKLG